MSSRKFSLEAYFLIKARSETPNFNSVGHCSNTTAVISRSESEFPNKFKALQETYPCSHFWQAVDLIEVYEKSRL